MRELDRLKVIQAVVDRMLKPGLAAERLNLTVRQVERLVLRYKQTGAAGVGSAARGRPGNRKLDEVTACRALVLIRDRYVDFGPTLACEKLRECHGLTLSKETVRHLMTDAGLWIPRKQRPPKIHQPRNRRSCLGELIQIDGSDHRWFEDRAPACTLLVFIDDAFNAHRALRSDEDLDLILTHRVLRCVSNSLTLQYDRVIYMLDDTPQTRALAHHYIDVYEYPDGRIEIRAHGSALAYRQYDRLSAMDQGAEVDNKRLEHVLALSRQVQMERDNRRISGSPSRTNQGEPVKPKMRANNTRKQRELRQIDMNAMMLRSAELRAAAVGK
ncbi:hypothetical protein AXG89_13425 [Burkholderia sp. PAMC 26561]|nr:hypothetical protein AXG89_13425 [Burkholderia sp. PAMC 26561]